MSEYFGEQDILEFLDTVSKQGIIPENTANAQKAAVIKVLTPLSEDERKRLDRNLNLEALYSRFINLCRKDLNPKSIKTYQGRFKTAFQSYLKWKKDSTSFSPRRKGRQVKSNPNNKLNSEELMIQQPMPALSKLCKFIIPISPNIFAHLELPTHLSASEATRINEFVSACTKSLVFEKTSST